MTSSETQITLYKQAKEGFQSLFIQMSWVLLELIIVLVATKGNPPEWLIYSSFILGVIFVAWRENIRQSELELMKKKIGQIDLLFNEVNNLKQLINNNNNNPINLSGIDLSAVTFSSSSKDFFSAPRYFKADLSKINLSRTKLPKAKLKFVQLIRADLSGADLSGTDLLGANLSGANLSGANLSGANLSGANLSGANLSGANLDNVKAEYAIFVNTVGINAELQKDLTKKGVRFIPILEVFAKWFLDLVYPKQVRNLFRFS